MTKNMLNALNSLVCQYIEVADYLKCNRMTHSTMFIHYPFNIGLFF